MTEDEMTVAVATLAELNRNNSRTEALNTTPSSAAQAYAIQDAVTAALGEQAGAFKANAPPGAPPVRGLIFTSRIFASPARVASNDLPRKGVEGEVAFRFMADLPARDTQYTRAEVVQAMNALPAIEIVSGRYTTTRPPLEQMADRFSNGALVVGPELTGWRSLDIANLQVKAWVNGEQILQKVGGHPIGDPVGVALAFVNLMRETHGVKAGQVVTVGSWTGILDLQPGDRFEVEFEGLGAAEVVFVGS